MPRCSLVSQSQQNQAYDSGESVRVANFPTFVEAPGSRQWTDLSPFTIDNEGLYPCQCPGNAPLPLPFVTTLPSDSLLMTTVGVKLGRTGQDSPCSLGHSLIGPASCCWMGWRRSSPAWGLSFCPHSPSTPPDPACGLGWCLWGRSCFSSWAL